MGKVETIQQLSRMGLNTPEILLDIKQFSEDRKKQWFDFYAGAVGKIGKVSIRTERDGDVKCPFFPNVALSRVTGQVQKAIANGYRIIVSKAINPVDSLFCGTICNVNNEKIILEWIEGPGTCRDIETSSKVNTAELRFDKTIAFKLTPEVGEVLMEVMPFLEKNRIFEWSRYPYPVGALQSHRIYWEIRPWQ